MSITIEEMQKQVHNLAREKGWWPFMDYDREYRGPLNPEEELIHSNDINFEEVNIPEKLMLMVSELGEALEFYRGDGITYPGYKDPSYFYTGGEDKKPDGFWIELADTIIRILDLAGAYNVNMEDLIKIKHNYNKTRPYRHGGKKC